MPSRRIRRSFSVARVYSPSRNGAQDPMTTPRITRMITNSYEVNSKRIACLPRLSGLPLFNDPLPSLLFATHPSGGSRNKRIRLGASSTWQSAAVVPYALLFRRPLHLYPRRLSLRNRPFHLCGPYQSLSLLSIYLVNHELKIQSHRLGQTRCEG